MEEECNNHWKAEFSVRHVRKNEFLKTLQTLFRNMERKGMLQEFRRIDIEKDG
jgi:hypothetical protein